MFIVAVLAASTAYELWVVGDTLEEASFAVVFGLMWLPLLVSVGLRLLAREPLLELGRAESGLGAAYGVPAACAAFTYGAALAVGAVHFQAPAEAGADASLSTWAVAALLDATLGVLLGMILAFGEEVGWRGYLVPRLVAGRVPGALALSGAVWGLYHLPLIVRGAYASSDLPWISAALFMATIVPAGVFFGWLRLASGSVWPAVLAHSVHNVFYQGIFGAWFAGALEPWLAGEAGAFSLAAYGAVALWLWRSGRLSRVSADGASAGPGSERGTPPREA